MNVLMKSVKNLLHKQRQVFCNPNVEREIGMKRMNNINGNNIQKRK